MRRQHGHALVVRPGALPRRPSDVIALSYWEPAWTAVEGSGWDPADPASGNAWENQALFGYDRQLLPAARLLGHR